MLSVIWSVLRVLGLILLILLGTVLILLLLVLFLPIVYRIQAKKQVAEEAAVAESGKASFADGLTAAVRVRWLFGFLRIRFLYPNPGNVVVRVLFFTLYDSGREETDEDISQEEDLTAENTAKAGNPPTQRKCARSKGKTVEERGVQEKTAEEREEAQGKTAEEREEAEAQKTATEEQEKTKAQEKTAEGQKETTTEEQEETEAREAAWEEVRARLRGKKPESKIDKIKYTIHNICGKIKGVRENVAYYKEVFTDEHTRLLLHHVLLRLGRILKSIRPRRLRGDVRFGAASPDVTGYAFGVYGMFAHCLGKYFILTPDFQQEVLEGEFYAAGHITLAKILWHGVMLALDKKLWEFISRIKKEE